MENAIFTCDRIAEFEQRAHDFETRYGGSVSLVEIIGRRWSYVHGRIPQQVTAEPPRRVACTSQWGVMIYHDENLVLTDEQIRQWFIANEPAAEEGVAGDS